MNICSSKFKGGKAALYEIVKRFYLKVLICIKLRICI